MPLDEGDLDRWRALSGLEVEESSREARATNEPPKSGNIGRVSNEGDTYAYTLHDGRSLRVRQQVEKAGSLLLPPAERS